MTHYTESCKPSWKRRALGAVFNRRTASFAFCAGLVTDLFGYAGVGGNWLLGTNNITNGAAPYYRGLGHVMHFSWQQMKSLGRDVDALVRRYSQP